MASVQKLLMRMTQLNGPCHMAYRQQAQEVKRYSKMYDPESSTI